MTGRPVSSTWWAAEDFDGVEVADVVPDDTLRPGDVVSWAPAGGVMREGQVTTLADLLRRWWDEHPPGDPGYHPCIAHLIDDTSWCFADVNLLDLRAAEVAALRELPGTGPGVTEPEVHE